MNAPKRRWLEMIAALAAIAALLISINVWVANANQRADDANERTAAQEQVAAVQADLIQRNADLIAELQVQADQLEHERATSELEACRAQNGANMATRALAAAIGDIIVSGLEASPHSATLAPAIAAQLDAEVADAATHDQDCSGDHVLDPADYP